MRHHLQEIKKASDIFGLINYFLQQTVINDDTNSQTFHRGGKSRYAETPTKLLK